MRRSWRMAVLGACLAALTNRGLAENPSAAQADAEQRAAVSGAVASDAETAALPDARAAAPVSAEESIEPSARPAAYREAELEAVPLETPPPAPKPPVPKPYKGVFYDNDFSYLEKPDNPYHFLGDSFKRMSLGERLKLDVGGEYRLRQHNEHILTRNDNFLLQRFRLYGDLHVDDWCRFYGEMIDAQSTWGDLTPRPTEINRFDALDLFGDVKFLESEEGKFWVRAGRQELLYGAQRLISPLDWSNTRRTFDGAKVFYRSGDWDVDGFWTRPVPFAQHLTAPHAFDHPDLNQEFYGVYASRKNLGSVTADLYFLRYAGVNSAPNFGYNTMGSRLEGSVDQWLWEVEGAYQFGDYGSATQNAGFYTLGLGRKLPDLPLKPVLWAYFDWASGDRNPLDGVHGTFNQLFPLGHKYLGYMDIVGRQNIEDLNVQLTLNPSKKVEFMVWYHIFKLQQARDGLYDAAGRLIRIDPTGAAGQDVGQELDLTTKIAFTPRTELLLGYSHLFPGAFLLDTPGGAPGKDFYYTQFSLRF